MSLYDTLAQQSPEWSKVRDLYEQDKERRRYQTGYYKGTSKEKPPKELKTAAKKLPGNFKLSKSQKQYLRAKEQTRINKAIGGTGI